LFDRVIVLRKAKVVEDSASSSLFTGSIDEKYEMEQI